jgi:2-methylaconitate cis-trans-isomerase PrpF
MAAVPEPSAEPPLLILCRDLLMGSKITAAAQSAGVPFRVVRDAAKLVGQQGRRLIVDLNQDGAVEAAAEWKRAAGAEVVGFVSHVDAGTIARAREAGLDQVMPRSRFVEQLPGILSR